MSESEILSILKELTGEESSSLYVSVVRAQYMILKNKIKPDVTEEELDNYADLLNYTGALMALLSVTCAENLTSPSEIKAGEVTITNSTDTEDMELKVKECIVSLGKILEDETFVFRVIDDE